MLLLCRKIDFFYAQWLIPITALYLIYFEKDHEYLERWLIGLYGFGIAITEFLADEPFLLQIVIAGLSLSMVAVYWIWYAVRHDQQTGVAKIPDYKWPSLSVGLSLSALACSLFATQSGWHNGYALIHSIWHCLAAFGQYHILCCRDAAPMGAALDAKISRKLRARV